VRLSTNIYIYLEWRDLSYYSSEEKRWITTMIQQWLVC